MHVRSLALVAVFASAACASHEGEDTAYSPKPATVRDAEPEPETPEPEPPSIVAKAAIASVQMIEDCPDAPPPPPAKTDSAATTPKSRPKLDRLDQDEASAAQAPAASETVTASAERVAAGASMDGSGPSRECTQSTMQLSFVGQGEDSGRVVIERVRMLQPGTFEELARIQARHPSSWADDGAYVQWNEIVPAKSSVKASYRISLPDWSAVEKKRPGASAYGHAYVLEVELTIDGRRQTVRSATFTREEPHIMVT